MANEISFFAARNENETVLSKVTEKNIRFRKLTWQSTRRMKQTDKKCLSIKMAWYRIYALSNGLVQFLKPTEGDKALEDSW